MFLTRTACLGANSSLWTKFRLAEEHLVREAWRTLGFRSTADPHPLRYTSGASPNRTLPISGDEMDQSSWLWLCLAAYAIHVLEEFVFNWQSWAQHVLKLPARWTDFYITNSVVVVLGIVAAMIVHQLPRVALGFAGLMLINAVFFHIVPFVATRGRFSPGLITAVILFLPLGTLTIRAAHLGIGAAFEILGVGAALMALPIVFLKLATMPYFNQDR